jgi:hypothetical protein
MLLLAGGEKAGKSYACAAFSSSQMIERTLWIEIGEGSADPYGAIPGARYEIVDHDGSYKGILQATRDAVAEPSGSKPNAIVVDSATELWDLLCSEQQGVAMKRGKETITMDQWNVAKKRWREWLDVLRGHKGPVLITARFEQVTVVKAGKPTDEKTWKVRAEKNLGFEVDGIIEVPAPREFYLSGMRSLKFPTPPGGHLRLDPKEGFSLDWFLAQLDIRGGERSYIPLREDIEEQERPIDLDLVSVCTQTQRQEINALLARLGLAEARMALPYYANVVGHPVAKTADLTKAEADKVLAALGADLTPPDLLQEVKP